MCSESVCKAFFVQQRQSMGSVKRLYLGELSSFYQGRIALMGVKWRRGEEEQERREVREKTQQWRHEKERALLEERGRLNRKGCKIARRANWIEGSEGSELILP